MAWIEGVLGAIHQVDVWVYISLNALAGNWLVDRIVAEEEANQLLKGGLFLALYWQAWFRMGPTQERRRSLIVAIVLAALSSVVVARAMATVLPFRTRPMFNSALPHMAFGTAIHPNMENWSAFPSDTATYFFALAFGMMQLAPRLGRVLIAFTATWICLPRLYIGLHYLTDILCGASIGVAMVYLWTRSEWVDAKLARPTLRAAEARSGIFYAFAFLFSMEMATLFDATRAFVSGIVRSARVGPHHIDVALWGAVALALLTGAPAGYLWWRRRSHRSRLTAAM